MKLLLSRFNSTLKAGAGDIDGMGGMQFVTSVGHMQMLPAASMQVQFSGCSNQLLVYLYILLLRELLGGYTVVSVIQYWQLLVTL